MTYKSTCFDKYVVNTEIVQT